MTMNPARALVAKPVMSVVVLPGSTSVVAALQAVKMGILADPAGEAESAQVLEQP